MGLLETTLIQVAGAVRAGWDYAAIGLGWIGRTLESLLQPVLKPLLGFLNPMCTAIGDVVFGMFESYLPLVGLTVISIVAGVVMLIAFRYLSNQTGIARAKDDIKANLLALKLFKDDLRVALKAQLRILWALLRLQRYILVPVLWMGLPTMLLLSQMAMRYQWRPLEVGDRFLFTIEASDAGELARNVAVEFPQGIEAEVGPIADKDDMTWRLRAAQAGHSAINISNGSISTSKEIVVGGGPGKRVSPTLPDSRWTAMLLYPVELPVPGESGAGGYIKGISVNYPPSKSVIYGSDYWVLTFFIISMASALLLKPLFKVRF